MTRPVRLPLLLAALLLALPAASPRAQPARNGNVWNGESHEPAAGAVQGNEAAAGVAPPAQKAQQENHDLAVMDRTLTQRAKQDANQMPPPPQPPNATGR